MYFGHNKRWLSPLGREMASGKENTPEASWNQSEAATVHISSK
jgi:hypothetical protein